MGSMKLTTIKRLLSKTSALSVVVLSSLVITSAYAQSMGNMGGSDKVSVGTMSILAAPSVAVAGSVGGKPLVGSGLAGMGSVLVVSGIAQGAKDTVEVILDASSGTGKVSIKLGRSAFEKVGVSVGTTVQVVAESTGTLLIASGKLLAFIPNTVGEALLYNEQVPGASLQ